MQIPYRFLSLFFGSPEVRFPSAAAVEEAVRRLRSELELGSDLAPPVSGWFGDVSPSRVRLSRLIASRFAWRGPGPFMIFDGGFFATERGSELRGHFEAPWWIKAFFGLWFVPPIATFIVAAPLMLQSAVGLWFLCSLLIVDVAVVEAVWLLGWPLRRQMCDEIEYFLGSTELIGSSPL